MALFPFVERVGVPSAIVGALLWLIFGAMGRLETKINNLDREFAITNTMLRQYKESNDERIKLLRERLRLSTMPTADAAPVGR